MANVIKPKRSNTAAAVPTTGQLTGGEIAVNMADRKIWINNGTAVVQVGAGKLSALEDVSISSPGSGEVLKYNTGTSKWENGAVVASTTTNISGGTANQIPYQTGASTTSFITAPTTTDTYLKWTGSAFSWTTVSSSGDMLKSVYDQNDDGIVDQAATAAVANAVPWSGITSKPNFASVATTGAYGDLTGTPVIGVNTQAWSANLDSWSALSTATKQDTLVSGTNIKSINSTSLLGSGDIAVQATLISGTNIKSIDGTSLLGSGDYSVLPSVGLATGDIHGIVDRTATTISFTEGTRTFTVTPVSGSWTFYNKGTLYTVSATKTIQIADTSGARFIRINPSTLNLEDGGSVPDFTNDVVLAYIYWNATTQKCIILGDERHGSKRDTTWHSNQHLNVGTIWRTGGALGYTLNNASTVSLDVGTPLNIADEDLLHQITHSASPTSDYQQILNTAASLEVLYLSGTVYASTTQSTTPWVAGTSLARYNLITGGSGSLVDASEGNYVTYWLLATNDTRRPVKLVLGRQSHATLDAAYAEDFTEYGLSFAEQVFMYQIVVQTSASYTANAAKIVIAAVRRVLTKLASSATSLPATQHNQLTGRDIADGHTIGAITGLQSALNAKQDTLVSATNIKTVNSNSLLGSGDVSVGTVTSVAALTIGTTGTDIGSTVATNTTTPVITLNIPTASATNRGALSSGDWSTFNDKQDLLVSGTNIKTINGTSVLGGGNITVSASAAGSTGNIQYNSGGALAGSANLNYDVANNRLQLIGTDPEIQLAAITTEPTVPSAGNIYIYAKNVGGRIQPKYVGPSGFDTVIQSSLGQNRISWWNAPGNNAAGFTLFNFVAPTASGTATARNVATTNVFTRCRRVGYVCTNAAGNYAGHFSAVAQYTVGSGTAGVGGFYYVFRFGFADTITTSLKFIGVSSSIVAPVVTASPATLTNCIGVGCASGDTNLSIYYGGSAAQTPIALGASFPARTNSTDLYELILFAPSNLNNTVHYRVLNITTNVESSGTLTAATPGTQLPANTTFLAHRAYVSNNATAGTPAIDFASLYIETDS